MDSRLSRLEKEFRSDPENKNLATRYVLERARSGNPVTQCLYCRKYKVKAKYRLEALAPYSYRCHLSVKLTKEYWGLLYKDLDEFFKANVKEVGGTRPYTPSYAFSLEGTETSCAPCLLKKNDYLRHSVVVREIPEKEKNEKKCISCDNELKGSYYQRRTNFERTSPNLTYYPRSHKKADKRKRLCGLCVARQEYGSHLVTRWRGDSYNIFFED